MVQIDAKQAFLMVGFPGSGKSTLAQKLCQNYEAKYLSSDEFRLNMFNSTRYASEEVSDEEVNKLRLKAHQQMYKQACFFIKWGLRVVIDATHLDTDKRLKAIKTLTSQVPASKLCFIVVDTDEEVISTRMKSQAINGIHSDWRRVYNYFLNKQKIGQVSWPTAEEGVDILKHEQLKRFLD